MNMLKYKVARYIGDPGSRHFTLKQARKDKKDLERGISIIYNIYIYTGKGKTHRSPESWKKYE